jgi:hypothetical protein
MSLDDAELRYALVATEKMTAWSQARHADVVAEMARRAQQAHSDASPTGVATIDCDPYRFVADEIAAELAVSKGAGSGRLAFALEMQAHPVVAEAMRHGQVDRGKAEEICAHLERLESPAFTEVLERAALDYAETHTRSQLRAWLNKRVMAAEPLLAEQRRERAKQQRRVRYFVGDDGMATLLADLPAEDALAIYRVIDQAAHASCAEEHSLNNVRDALPEDLVQQVVPDRTPDGRTMDQRRADAFTDLVLGPILGQAQHVPMLSTVAATSARVIVDAETLAGMQDQPGELVGYGAITAEHARELVDAEARWRRLLTDPIGGLLEVSPQRYRPSRRLADFVVDRDVTCRFPGCRRPAAFFGTDLDHTTPFPVGATVAENLASLCRSHHLLKTHSEWKVEQGKRGSLTWTTPSGRVFRTFPHDYRSGAPPGKRALN